MQSYKSLALHMAGKRGNKAMVFSSLFFVFAFLALNLVCYCMARTIKQKNIVLLIFSIVFYAWGGLYYTVLLVGMAFWSWLCALMIEKKGGKLWLIMECVVLLGLLIFFKYTNFITTNLSQLVGFPKEATNIALPIGISFYTFQLLSYVVDVYRGEVKAQPAFWKVLLYCSLFHQCIAGPIVRYQTVAEEIDDRSVSLTDVTDGIRRFSVGLAKKAVLANACAAVADDILANTGSATTAGLWLGMLFYMLQIYLDFSAYSDMAIGMGRMVGFHYLENFNYPYAATSVQDFWRRWHISLSTFFRDYVYIPLGGNRRGNLITFRNMFIVWGLTGLWHGASWNYILWGLYFFVFLALERFVLKPVMDKIPNFITWIFAMIVVYFGWVLFRFTDLNEMWEVLKGMFGAQGRTLGNLSTAYVLLNNVFLLAVSIIAVLPIGRDIRQFLYRRAAERERVPRLMYYIDALTPVILIVLSVMALVGNSYNPFLYFQF